MKSSPRLSDYKANHIKKLKFLVLCNLQYSAILSQLAQHEKSLENAKKTWIFIVEMFHDCFEYVKDLRRIHEQCVVRSCSTLISKKPGLISNNLTKKTLNESSESGSYTKSPTSNNLLLSLNNNGSAIKKPNAGQNMIKKPLITMAQQVIGQFMNESTESSSLNKSPQIIEGSINMAFGKSNTVGFIKNEISFSKIVIDYAYPILDYVTSLKTQEEISSQGKEMLTEVRKSLYFWKNNPENNEKYIRKELKLPIEKDEEGKRSLLGVADSTEWLETFNIGAIMHMNPITYEEFMFYGEIIYEVSKKLLLEKVIYFSVILFTMATEIRFIELEKAKPSEKKKNNDSNDIDNNDNNNGKKNIEISGSGVKTS